MDAPVLPSPQRPERAGPPAPSGPAAAATTPSARPPHETAEAGGPEPFPGRRKALTIGAVCELLTREFPDISISKIRYLEDQKLLSPRRTQGGYRLYSPGDLSRLQTILRLQRDEFLPLRVIRQELASGRADEPSPAPTETEQRARRLSLTQPSLPGQTLDEVIEETGADARLVRELEEYGLVRGHGKASARSYDVIEREIVRAAGELTRYGVAARNLRVFRTSADREAALLEQILGPALRSRNRERRKEAVETLESLAAIVTHLKHLLLVQDLRGLVED
jgi:DNA-binding transcriptional MerR regulator